MDLATVARIAVTASVYCPTSSANETSREPTMTISSSSTKPAKEPRSRRSFFDRMSEHENVFVAVALLASLFSILFFVMLVFVYYLSVVRK